MTKRNNTVKTKEEIFETRLKQLNSVARYTKQDTDDVDICVSDTGPRVIYGKITSFMNSSVVIRNGKNQYTTVSIGKETFITGKREQLFQVGNKLAVVMKEQTALLATTKKFVEEHFVSFPYAEDLLVFFSRLPKRDQQNILFRFEHTKIHEAVVNPKLILSKNGVATGIDDTIENNLATYACLIIRSLPPATQKAVQRLISQDACSRFSRSDEIQRKHIALEGLLLPPAVKELRKTQEQIIQGLDEAICGREEVKQKLSYLIVSAAKKRKKLCLILTGPDGCGKETMIKALSRTIDLPLCQIPLAGASAMDLAGSSIVYAASDYGDFMVKSLQNQTTQGVYYFSNADLIDRDIREGAVTGTLYEAADEDSSGWFDRFSSAFHNIDHSILILSADDRNRVPSRLLQVYSEIRLEGYSDEDKVSISQFMLEKLLEDAGIDPDAKPFDEGVLAYVASKYTADYGFNQMLNCLRLVLEKYEPLYREDKDRVITREMIDEWLSVDESDPRVIFKRNNYEQPVKKDIETALKIHEDDSLSKDCRNKAKCRLDVLLGLKENGLSPANAFNKEVFIHHLNQKYICNEKIKTWLGNHLFALSLKNNTMGGLKLLLIGPPGVGKTELAGCLAEALGRKLVKIGLDGCTDVDALLKGSLRIYDNAKPGRIIEEIAKAETKYIVLLLDEIDKARRKTGELNGCDALLDYFGSTEFTDHYLGYPVDISSVITVCTANSDEFLSQHFVDRFDLVVNLKGYTRAEKRQILEKSGLRKIAAKYCPETTIDVQAEALDMLLEHSNEQPGVRNLIRAAEEVVVHKLNCIENAEMESGLSIHADDVKEALEIAPPKQAVVPPCAGFSYAVGVDCFGRGSISSIETVKIQEPGIHITGLLMDDANESVQVALTVSKNLLADASLNDIGLHIHFSQAAVPKNGTSAGLALFMSIMSCLRDERIKQKAAFTGEIGPNGYVSKVGSLYEKALGCQAAGIETLYAPVENVEELTEDQRNDLKGIKLVAVRHVRDAMDVI